MPDFKYKNIVISGLPGTGESTLMKLLGEKLSSKNWTTFSGGGFMRQYAIEKGLFDPNKKEHHSAETYDEDFDRQVDLGMRKWLQEKDKMIIEAWLAGFMAQGIPDVIKILLVCKKALRIDRIVNRDEINVNDVKEDIESREIKNNAKWSKMYEKEWQDWVVDKGITRAEEKVKFWDNRLYDLVIDTYKFSKKETFEIAYNALQNGVQEKFYVSEKYHAGEY